MFDPLENLRFEQAKYMGEIIKRDEKSFLAKMMPRFEPTPEERKQIKELMRKEK